MNHDIIRTNSFIPAVDHELIHLIYVCKWSIAILDDVLVKEVRVTNEEHPVWVFEFHWYVSPYVHIILHAYRSCTSIVWL